MKVLRWYIQVLYHYTYETCEKMKEKRGNNGSKGGGVATIYSAWWKTLPYQFIQSPANW